mgnify:CR=1 FL=1
MKIILKQDIRGKGKKGQMIEAAEGYARNYLIPRGLAVEATADAVNTMNLQAKAKAKADAALTKAGCVDCELGRTALAAFDGDVEKLVEAKPFLFKAQGQMGTGGRQAGSADATPKSIKEALRQTNR